MTNHCAFAAAQATAQPHVRAVFWLFHPHSPIYQVPEPKGVSRQEQASRRRAPNTVLVAKPRHKQDPTSFNTRAITHT